MATYIFKYSIAVHLKKRIVMKNRTSAHEKPKTSALH